MKACFLLAALAVLASRPALAEPPSADYKLAWADEFNGKELDTTKWEYRGLGPRRKAINSKECVALDGQGNLVLTTKRVDDKLYTAMIGTAGKYETAFGYFECRVKLQQQQGHWSAFWLQSPTMTEVADPKDVGTEIDVFEYLAREPEKIQTNLHWNGYGKDHKHAGHVTNEKSLPEGWHTVGFEWTPDEYIFFLDGKETWRTDKAVSHVKEYIILSLEVDSWGGDISKAQLPDSLLVDYVRVYKKP